MAIAAIAGLASVGGAMIAAQGLIGIGAAFGAFALGAGLSMVSRALAPKPNLGARMRGLQSTTRQPAGSRKAVYGEMRVGGQVLFIGNSGDDNAYLHLVVAFASHEIEEFRFLHFNETTVWSSSGGVDTGWTDILNVYTHDGTQTTADTNLVADVTEWTNDHKLLGISYVHVKMKWDADFFPNGVPNITAQIKGKKVYDPRTSTTAYSDNPALCLRDYLTSSYGLGEPTSRIDDNAVTTAANLCEELVNLAEGGTQQRYRCNGQLDTANQIKSNIEQLMSAMGGVITFTGGKYIMRGSSYQTPSVEFTESDFVSEIQTQTKQSRRSQYNTVKGIFVSSEDSWKVQDYPAQRLKTTAGDFVTGTTYEILTIGTTDFTAIGASANEIGVQFVATGAGTGTGTASLSVVDDGSKLELDMPLPFVTYQQQAQRLAKIVLNKSRQQIVLSASVNLKGLKVKIGDNVYITNSRLGFSQKVFEVIDYALDISAGGEAVVNLQLIETAAAVYDWTTSDEEDYVSGGEVDLDNGRSVPAVTNLSLTEIGLVGPDATLQTSVRLTWSLPDYAFIGDVLVYWRKSTEGEYSEYASVGPESTEHLIQGLEPDNEYDFAVQLVNLIGVHSNPTSLQDQLLSGDVTAPALPTGVSARGDFEGVVVTWLNPADIDFKHVEVFASDSGTTPSSSASPTAVVDGEVFLDLNLEGGDIRYYWLRSVDYSNNKSAFTTRVRAIASSVRIKNLGLLLNQNAYPTNLPAPQIKSGEQYEIQTVGTSDFTEFGASANTVGTTFTASRDGDNDDGTGTVEHTSYESNNGELAIVGTKLDGTLRYGQNGSIVWNGVVIDVAFNQTNNFTAVTNLAGKQGWIGFDRNKTAPFDLSGALPNCNVGFVYYEDGQWYYDDNSATPVAFNPDSFTGTTTGTDGSTTARIVALGTLKTGTADTIVEGGLFADPLDLRTVELPENFVDVTKFATQLESDNYSQDSAGWKIERSGDVEFNDITARGEIHAESGTIASTVTIGGTEIGDIESMVNGSLALYINKDAGQTTANGEGAIVGVSRDGAPVNDSNGFIVWNGSKITIESNQLTSTASFATQVTNQRGFIVFDANKSNPFDISAGTVQSIDVAFAYKIDDQWYYDDNTTATATSGQTFDPENTSGAEFVALGWLETGSSDVIKYGGLYGQPVALTLAAFPSDALESGTIGGIKISNNKLYEGVGTFKDANTGFYLDSGGDFSLKDKLSFDNSAGELIVKGEIDAEILNVVEANVLGGINATSISDGIVSFNSFNEKALSSLDTRFGRTGGFFDEELLGAYDGTGTQNVSLGSVSHDGVSNFVLSWSAIKSWVSSTNISGDGLKLKVTFSYSSGGSTTTLGSTLTFAATKTQLQNGDYVYDFNETTRLEVTGSSISAGNITLGVKVEEFSSASNCFELLDAQTPSDFLRFEFIANQDNPNLTVTGTLSSGDITAGDITADDATFDAGTNTTITVISNDPGESQIRLYGETQGTGRLYVGQNNVYGGGIEYNGDNNPTGAGAGSDRIALFRVDNGTYHWTARNLYNSNSWEFRGGVTSANLTVGGLIYPAADGTSGQVITTDGSGNLSFSTVSGGGSGDITSVIAGTNLTGGATSGAATLNVAQKLTGNVVELTGGIAFDPEGGGTGTDTASDVGIALSSGTRIVGTNDGYIRNLLDWNSSSSIDIGQIGTSIINGVNLYGGNGSTPLKYQNGNGYITIGSNNSSYSHFYTDRPAYYFNKKIVVDEGIINSYNEDLQLAAGVNQAAAIVIDYPSNEVTFNEHLNIASGARINHNTDSGRDKIRVWGSSAYAIGMDNAMSYGHLNDYAMTFQFSNTDARGWVFLDTGHSDAQGAMSLSTNGKMTLATSLSVGEGESITSPSTKTLYVGGEAQIAGEITGSRLTSTIHGDSVNAFGYLAGGDTDEDNKSNYITHGDTGVTVVRSWDGTSVGNIATFGSTGIDVTGNLTVDAGSNGKIEFGNITTNYGRLYADSTGTFVGSVTADPLIFRTTNTERMRITSVGSIQIPNQNAINELEFTGTEYTNIYSDTTSGMDVGTRGSGYLRLLTNNTEAMRIDSSGQLIVKANAGSTSHVFTYNENGGEIQLYDSAGQVGTLIDQSNNATRFLELQSGSNMQIGMGGGTTGEIGFFKAGFAQAMVIKSDGDVGINVSNPTAKLSVYGGNNLGGIIDFQGNSNGAHPTSNFGGAIAYNSTAGDGEVAFWNCWTGAASHQGGFEFNKQTGASTHTSLMKLGGDGKVGINNESADSTLNVKGQAKFGDTTDATQIRINASANSGIVESNAPSGLILRSNAAGSLSHIVFNTNGSTEAMRIRHDQIVLIGTISAFGAGGVTFSPSASNGALTQIFNRASTTSTSVVMRFRNNGNNVGRISHNSTSTSYITSSDQRLKENIVDAPSAAASADIDAIQVRSFDWKESGEHQKYGMIAQELQTVAPDAVAEGDEDDDIMGVDYSKLVPMLIKEIQSLRARVALLEDN